MHKPHNSISSIITKYFEVSLKSTDFAELYEQTILHFAGGSTAFEYQKWLHCKMHLAYDTGGKPLSGKDFRLKLDALGYCILNIKLFVQHVLGTRGALSNETLARKIAREFEIDPTDARRIHKLLTRRSFRGVLSKTKVNHVPMSLREVELLWEHEVHPHVVKKARIVAHKRLRFLAKSQNVELSSFVDDLIGGAIRAYYKCLPTTKGISYILNYVKRSVENYALNIIESDTTEKRGRLICTGLDASGVRQFSMLVTSSSQMRQSVDGDGNSIDVMDLIGDGGRHVEQTEAAVLVRQLMRTVKEGSKGSTYLSLLLGEPDQRFTAWLRAKRAIPKDQDNTDLEYLVSHDAHHRLIAEFLSVEPERARRFMQKMRARASGHLN